MEKDSGLLHFTIGEDFGHMITSLAQEQLLYEYDLGKAITSLTGSLVGLNKEQAWDILLGVTVIVVDVKDQICDVVPYNEKVHVGYNPIDIKEWLRYEIKKISKTGFSLKDVIKSYITRTTNRSSVFEMDVSFTAIMKMIGGDTEDLVEEIRSDSFIDQLTGLIKVSKTYLEHSQRVNTVYYTIKALRPELLEDLHVEHYLPMIDEVARTLNDLITSNGNIVLEENESLDNYLKAHETNDKIIAKGIEPVDIKLGFNAGYLAPNGDYYGMNGEIANMLHLNIADALQTVGIIPSKEGLDSDVRNADDWLEQNGWVKIHDDWILYEGYNLHKRDIKNVPLTEIQIKKIYEYGQLCHTMGRIKVGFKMQWISAARFEMTEPLMYYKYFEY